MGDGWIACGALVLIVVCFFFGATVGESTVAHKCKDIGAFMVDGAKYQCAPVSK